MTALEKRMSGFVIMFLASALWPSLPHFSLIACMILLLSCSLYFKISAWLTGLVAGALWASLSIHYYLNLQVDAHMFNQNVIVQGHVVSLVHQPQPMQKRGDSVYQNESVPTQESVKFNFKLNTLGQTHLRLKPVIRVSWFNPSMSLSEGQSLRLFIRLKPPVGLGNPDGYNYQQWLVSKNIAASAYVISSPSNQMLDDTKSLRQTFVNRLLSYDVDNMPWILALSYGDRSLLSTSDWQLMQHTGTAHLFAISGMHLGIVYGFVFLLLKITLIVPLRLLAKQAKFSSILLVLSALFCTFYAHIAGFEVPVMRALIAILIWTFLRLCGLHWRLSSVFLLLLVIFFVLFPFAHLGISFWFSFSAVVLIWLFVWRFKLKREEHVYRSTWRRIVETMTYALRLQLFLSLMTLPTIILAFGILPFTSLLANVFMIPIVTFVLVPLCLLIAVCIALQIEPIYLLEACDWVFKVSIGALGEVSTLGSISTHAWELTLGIAVMLIGVLLVSLLPRSQYRINTFAIALLTSAIGWRVYAISQDANKDKWEILAFDVGQGTSIVVRQQSGFLIYDTGPAFRGGFSMAQSVLLPYFEGMNMPVIDYLVLSHFDNDHSGGLSVLQKNLSIDTIMSPQQGCYGDKYLQWDAIKIEVLWPLNKQSGEDNNHSCVLKLSTPEFSILLAGDIEKSAEQAILEVYQGSQRLNADILLAPHHGSRTSSTHAFVRAVSPKFVIFTAGYNNRWGFPADEVVSRFDDIGAVLLNTGLHGRVRLTVDKQTIQASRYRQDEYNRWFNQTR